MYSNDKFKKGMLYEIGINNTNVTKTDDTSSSMEYNTANRYSIYGVKLTDSCLNAIMEFLKAKTNDPTHCTSELEITTQNDIPLNGRMCFNQHNLRDKQKNFNIRIMDDNPNSSNNNLINKQHSSNEIISQQDVVMGIKFSNDSKKLLSVGHINYKLAVMGNNEAFDITKKKIETQAQQREQSKAKCIKSSTAKTATIRNTSIVKNSTNPQINGICSNGRNSLNSIKKALINVPNRNMPQKAMVPLSNMKIRNISRPSNDLKMQNSTEDILSTNEDYSLKDHIIFSLLLTPMTLDDLCKRVTQYSKKSITKTTIYHLIKTLTSYDKNSRIYSLLSSTHKTISQVQNWPFYNSEEKKTVIHHVQALNNNRITPSENVDMDNIKKRDNSELTSTIIHHSNDGQSIVEKSNNSRMDKAPKLDSTLINKSKVSGNKTTDFEIPYPTIINETQLNNYTRVYEDEYPQYLEKKIKLDNLTAKIKVIRAKLQVNPKDRIQRKLLSDENRNLENDAKFNDLYDETKYLHYKLAHIKDMINNYQNRSNTKM